LVAGGEEGLVFAEKFIFGSDVADGGVQAHGGVVVDEPGDEAAGLFEVERGGCGGCTRLCPVVIIGAADA
jgi:hypothetical protein